jgi:uncharacterized phiE125 gp8 family phage protein
MGLIRITDPTTEPLTLDEAKLHCRKPLDETDDDQTFLALIKAAREAAEGRTQRAIAKARFQFTMDTFPPSIRLPMPRVLEIVSIQYRDTDGVLTVLDSAGYVLDNSEYFSNWVYPALGYSMPQTWTQPNGVTVTYDAGFNDGTVPESIKLWLKLAIGAWYDLRAGMDIAPLPMQAFELPPTFFGSLLEPWIVMQA